MSPQGTAPTHPLDKEPHPRRSRPGFPKLTRTAIVARGDGNDTPTCATTRPRNKRGRSTPLKVEKGKAIRVRARIAVKDAAGNARTASIQPALTR